MIVQATVVLAEKNRLILDFPLPIQLPHASLFQLQWGCRPLGVKAVSRLIPTRYELHLDENPTFPIFEAGKYESFPENSLSKIKLDYLGTLRCDLNGEVVGEPVEFHFFV